jgi:hypothetical protein
MGLYGLLQGELYLFYREINVVSVAVALVCAPAKGGVSQASVYPILPVFEKKKIKK